MGGPRRACMLLFAPPPAGFCWSAVSVPVPGPPGGAAAAHGLAVVDPRAQPGVWLCVVMWSNRRRVRRDRRAPGWPAPAPGAAAAAAAARCCLHSTAAGGGGLRPCSSTTRATLSSLPPTAAPRTTLETLPLPCLCSDPKLPRRAAPHPSKLRPWRSVRAPVGPATSLPAARAGATQSKGGEATGRGEVYKLDFAGSGSRLLTSHPARGKELLRRPRLATPVSPRSHPARSGWGWVGATSQRRERGALTRRFIESGPRRREQPRAVR